jgi:hypothetical protein
MLFVTYWELNEDHAVDARIQAARRLTEGGIFPPAGVNVLRWDATPDGWGILVFEADTAAAATHALNLWRTAAAGFFRLTRTAPAVTVQEAIQLAGDELRALGNA